MAKRAVMLLLLVWLQAGQAMAGGGAVSINGEATVTGPRVVLGELAVITGDDSERVRRLRELPLGGAPLPGKSFVLTAQTFNSRLAGTGADLSGIEWRMPQSVTITTAAQTISADRIQCEAIAALKKELGMTSDNNSSNAVTFTVLNTPQAVVVPLGQVEYKVEVPYGIRYNVPTTVKVGIGVKGYYSTTVSLNFDVKAYANVVVAARSLPAFEVLTADSVRCERRDIGTLTGYITDMGKTIGQMTRRPLTAGMPLTEAMLDKPPIVQRFSGVTILARVGDSVVTAGGMALQQGAAGEFIRVQNIESKRIINARVVDKSTVEVMIYSGR